MKQDIINVREDMGGVHHYVYRREKNGKSIYYLMNSVQINYADSMCTAFIIRDETAMVEIAKKTEDENYSKRLVASITHDLRTPLNAIMGISEALEEFVGVEGKHFLKLVRNTGTLMLYLINDVLDLAQIEAKKLTLRKDLFGPCEIIEETIQLMQFNFNQKGLVLMLRLAPAIPVQIFSDKTRYRQILLNLLGNALKFTSKGSVTVEVRYDSKYDVMITKVIDTGAGIPPEDFSKLFQLFGRISNTDKINPSGVGLGLHICKSLSGQLGGNIYAESILGEGSAFTFYISCELVNSPNKAQPTDDYIKNVMNVSLQDKEEMKDESILSFNLRIDTDNDIHHVPLIKNYFFNPEIQKPVHEIEIPIKPTMETKVSGCDCPQILVVDDNELNIYVLISHLKTTKHKTQTAHNGKEAIDFIVERHKSHCCKNYKAIYMDINMPIMDGIEATTILKKMMSEGQVLYTPIIALSALDTKNNEEISSLFQEVLSKPINKSVFLSSVEGYCNA